MNVIIRGQLLEILTKEYEFEGVKGLSHKLNIYAEGKLYNVTIKKEAIKDFEKLVGQNIEIECNLFIKGAYNLRLSE